ncbi:uncharacterized protein LOC62_01G001615 [Vanrija pseudolonga]|uniref:Uncharacterized protein n=1 Tax=Vanrija pseudolonga TaxID=143232 RepID=A0AAF0Y299_9TREE|nr:hypothetical protein LOC62_01G001615 [Vanrija pseudolonga]
MPNSHPTSHQTCTTSPAHQPNSSSTCRTCMRVNKFLHDTAGAYLYHTVRLDHTLFGPFFLGALKLHNQLSHCDWCDGEGGGTLACANSKSRKAQLLSHVRVLSIGSHTRKSCHEYGELAGALLTHLRTLRIVPTPASLFSLERYCDDSLSRHGCAFIYHIEAMKIILRNMDEHQTMYSVFRWKTLQAHQEIVLVLPTDARRFDGSNFFLRGDMEDSTASRRYLFHDSSRSRGRSSRHAVPTPTASPGDADAYVPAPITQPSPPRNIVASLPMAL